MSERVRISAVVQTYNAEKHLERCLHALAPFDEILVVDMESTDATRDIAARHGARVVVKERGEHRMVEAYRNFAIHEARYDWVLVVDADEIVPRALADYLYAEIGRDPSPRAFLIPIKNYFMGRWMRANYPDVSSTVWMPSGPMKSIRAPRTAVLKCMFLHPVPTWLSFILPTKPYGRQSQR